MDHKDVDIYDKENGAVHSEVLVDNDAMNSAIEGENREHQMGVWEAAKTYPWACFWAFTMCFTIVSLRQLHC